MERMESLASQKRNCTMKSSEQRVTTESGSAKKKFRSGACLECGILLLGSSRKFCSGGHGAKYRLQKNHDANPPLGITTGTMGAIGELRVAAELLSKGYEVFRAVSPACSCDLAVLKNGQLLRIEVRTAPARPTNSRVLAVTGIVNNVDKTKSDIAAIISRDGGKIEYHPPLPEAKDAP